ncbi:O-antigen ligase family protein [Catenovulum sp. 2E275]|uniref:O-antigen ligase family protein n=1 Tax=Catenovulum sp. 2E275 TaxID=2980497 RepID=UPI0021D15726|nr:O-antigen ligase family protein [Catenovulum sp. 2E275]MCU4674817.1 O-antigen ligase family protein [Catenovulum sp. 2E275]
MINHLGERGHWIHGLMLVLALLFLCDFFTPDLKTGSVMNAEIGGAGSSGGGFNTRSLFWIGLFLGTVALYALATVQHVFRPGLTSTWLISIILAFGSVLYSEYPAISTTRCLLLLLASYSIVILYGLTYQSEKLEYYLILYSGVLLFANIASVPFGGVDLSGAFKGIASSKNAFGAIASVNFLMCLGLYLQSRVARNFWILVLAVIWLLLLLASHSKSSIAFSILLAGVALFQNKYIFRFVISVLAIYIFIFAIFPIYFYLIGENILDWYASILDPELFTGRGEIWSMIFEDMGVKQLYGVGYGAYWAVGEVREIFDIEYSFFTVLNSAHNGMLHIITNIGTVGLLVLFSAMFVSIYKGQYLFERYELLILAFIMLHSMFESSMMLYKFSWFVLIAIVARTDFMFVRFMPTRSMLNVSIKS